jgi:hypothetical protein
MHAKFSRLSILLLAGLFLAPDARAQFVAPVQPGGQIRSVPTSPAYTPVPVPYTSIQPTYPAYGGYYPPYGYGYGSRAGSTYTGLANLTAAAGQYSQDYQRARLLNQEAERSKIQTRQMLNDSLRYEEAMRPKADDVAAQRKEQDLRRAMNDPPITEILSGEALNTLLKSAQKYQSMGAYGPSLSLEQDNLTKINVTTTGGSNVAMFRNNGKLTFPFVLRVPSFDEDRKSIQDGVYKALEEARSPDGVNPLTVRAITKSVDKLAGTVEKNAPDMDLTDTIQANNYVAELRTNVAALKRPDVSQSLAMGTPKGRTTGEMVSYMTKNGLIFGPSVSGDEGAYRALHNSLVAFNLGLMQQTQVRR